MQKEKRLGEGLTPQAFLSRCGVWGGRLLAGGSLLFILLKLRALWDSLGMSRITGADVLWLGFAALIWGIGNALPACAWGRWIACLSDRRLKFAELMPLYAKANLAKYLPGNIMHYVSRSVIAQKYNIPLQTTALAALLDVLTAVFSALLFVLPALCRDLFAFFATVEDKLPAMGIIFGAALGLCFLALKKTGFWKLSPGQGRKFSGAILQSVPLYFGYYILTSFIFCLLLFWGAEEAFRPYFFDMAFLWKTAGFYTFAWLVGFLTPGASGGIGVREAVLLLLLHESLPEKTVLISAVLSRVLSIAADIVTYVFSRAVLKRRFFHDGFSG